MPAYKVEWEQETYNFDSPLEAVKACLYDINNGESLLFTATDLTTDKRYSVDLNEIEGQEVEEQN